MAAIHYLSLEVNCGFARAAIYHNTPKFVGCNARLNINKAERASKFHTMFSNIPTFGIPEDYYEGHGKKRDSKFDNACNKVLDGFKQKKWKEKSGRDKYLAEFSPRKWLELSTSERQKHTLARCNQCYDKYKHLQEIFPLKPTYIPPPVLMVDTAALQRQGVKPFTRNALSCLDNVYEQQVSTTFTDAAVKIRGSGLEKRKTKHEKRKEKRQIQRKYTMAVNEKFAENATIAFLAEGKSKRQYHRDRLSQSYASPECTPPPAKKPKLHSPSINSPNWDTRKLEYTLKSWPIGTPINWTAIGQQHGITNKNKGQVAKEFATNLGIDPSILEGKTPKRRVRHAKKRLPGKEISIPVNPSIQIIEQEIKKMLDNGRFTLGEECTPYELTRYTPHEGKIVAREVRVHGRKIPLEEIRERLLKRHQKYMRLPLESAIEQLPRTELSQALNKLDNAPNDNYTTEELRTRFYNYQRTRSLALWHDHATLLGIGFIMVTVHVMYDPAVFFTDEEYIAQNKATDISIQSEVEQPDIHMLCMGSSSISDQAALLGDRVDCLITLSTPIVASNGVEIYDKLRFFTGDHPAAQFEQGTQQGGRYKCGSCGCRDVLFSDQAHSLQWPWRSLATLQGIATAGVFGKKAGVTKPLDKLHVNDLRRELRVRGVANLESFKPELQQQLDDILKDVQRVPALLLLNPCQSLASINLQHYEVVACEPLHDLKGHLSNLLHELPHILPDPVATKLKPLLKACLSKEKITAADLRTTMIKTYLMLSEEKAPADTVYLLKSIVKISDILYSKDNHRTPRSLLQLYNNCWVHLELCNDLLSNPKEVTHSKLFGHYLHALTAHAPVQYEIACLRSLNTENQERIFGQAREIAKKCTNHHPENMIPQILLRMQAKQDQRKVILSVQQAETQVSKVAHHLTHFSSSHFTKAFLKQHGSSWQVHLQRISSFLAKGKGVWWQPTPDGFVFFDGDADPEIHPEGPFLDHFRHSSITQVQERQQQQWTQIMENRMELPAVSIQVYNTLGILQGRLVYREEGVTFVPHPVHKSTETAKCSYQIATEPSTPTESASPLHTSHFEINIQPLTSKNKETEFTANSYNPDVDEREYHQMKGTVTNLSDLTTNTEENPPTYDTSAASHSTTSIADPDPDPEFDRADDNREIQIINLETEANIPSIHTSCLQTSLAAAIANVIGHDGEITQFDQLRHKLKEAKKHKRQLPGCKKLMEQHEKLLSLLGTRVLKHKGELQQNIRKLEQDFFNTHGCLPTAEKDSQYANLIKQRNAAKNLLRHLNIML